MNQQPISIAIIILLVVFAIFRRVRRNIGWQPLNTRKLIIRSILFLVIGLVFMAEGVSHPLSLVSDIVGIVLGAGLAYYGAGLTRYEQRGERWFYQPNTWIGSVVIALFLGRLVYRLFTAYSMGAFNGQAASSAGMNQMNWTTGSSWSAGFLLIMFAYYVCYYIILLRKRKHLIKTEETAQFINS